MRLATDGSIDYEYYTEVVRAMNFRAAIRLAKKRRFGYVKISEVTAEEEQRVLEAYKNRVVNWDLKDNSIEDA